MKSAEEWTKLMRDDVDLRLARREKPERIDEMLADWMRAIQADALEAAAKLCFDGTIETQMLDWDLARAQCAEAIRKLKEQVQR